MADRRFTVWCPDPLEATEEDGRTIEAPNAREAAVCWARWWDWSSADFPIANGSPHRVCVRDEDGVLTTWDLGARTEVVYVPREVPHG